MFTESAWFMKRLHILLALISCNLQLAVMVNLAAFFNRAAKNKDKVQNITWSCWLLSPVCDRVFIQ